MDIAREEIGRSHAPGLQSSNPNTSFRTHTHACHRTCGDDRSPGSLHAEGACGNPDLPPPVLSDRDGLDAKRSAPFVLALFRRNLARKTSASKEKRRPNPGHLFFIPRIACLPLLQNAFEESLLHT